MGYWYHLCSPCAAVGPHLTLFLPTQSSSLRRLPEESTFTGIPILGCFGSATRPKTCKDMDVCPEINKGTCQSYIIELIIPTAPSTPALPNCQDCPVHTGMGLPDRFPPCLLSPALSSLVPLCQIAAQPPPWQRSSEPHSRLPSSFLFHATSPHCQCSVCVALH